MQLAAAAAEATKAAALHQLDTAVLTAVRAVGGAPEATPVWLAAVEALTAAGAPLHGLLDQLTAACLGQQKGSVRVRTLQSGCLVLESRHWFRAWHASAAQRQCGALPLTQARPPAI